ncbi:MAG: hypothetical protein R3C10_25620 [Pirellulales bacterium]
MGTPILDVQGMENGDGTYTWWISINPNIEGYDQETATLEVIIMGDIYQSLLTDPTAIAVNGGDPNVVFSSQRAVADLLDDNYDAARDTVVDDTLWPGKNVIQQTPADGTQYVRVLLTSFTGGLGGPIPDNDFFPLAHITTDGAGIWVAGELQTIPFPEGFFSVHLVIPEPATNVLLVVGAFVGLGLSRIRRPRSR